MIKQQSHFFDLNKTRKAVHLQAITINQIQYPIC